MSRPEMSLLPLAAALVICSAARAADSIKFNESLADHLSCTRETGELSCEEQRTGRFTATLKAFGDMNPGDKAIEADNNDVAPFTQLVCSGRSNPTVSNFTMIGDQSRSGAAYPGSVFGVNLRRATAGNACRSCWYASRGEVEALYTPRGLVGALPALVGL